MITVVIDAVVVVAGDGNAFLVLINLIFATSKNLNWDSLVCCHPPYLFGSGQTEKYDISV